MFLIIFFIAGLFITHSILGALLYGALGFIFSIALGFLLNLVGLSIGMSKLGINKLFKRK